MFWFMSGKLPRYVYIHRSLHQLFQCRGFALLGKDVTLGVDLRPHRLSRLRRPGAEAGKRSPSKIEYPLVI